ncbi:Hypothetical predicted protein [Paramuricea clavata]|uniref:Uncharacterized protein n=1 Tax=Paramuricea clavata TaxID=317549 RepID=A0A6S7JEE3_PARCT|nr:Hypothetical predicted protein [Paramuricea clavata]
MDAASHALYAGITHTKGGDISVQIFTNNVEVAKELINKVGGKVGLGIGVTLGALLAYKVFKPLIEDAVRNGFGGERDDQEVKDIRQGSLQVLLHCFTDERFLEVLEEIESGTMKEHLRKEFFDIGVETEDLIVKIENIQEVNKTKEAISKRYKSNCAILSITGYYTFRLIHSYRLIY